MYKSRTTLALITARGGSKDVPGKNIKKFAGKPLIKWTILQALKSRFIDRTIVSTDSKEIAAISEKCGADLPFVRPKQLATSTAKSIDVVIHALNWLERNEKAGYDVVVLLQPTSPLRTTADIDTALKLFFAKKAKAVVSVCDAEHPPLWTNRVPKDLSMKGFLAKNSINRNRQSLGSFYRLNGAVYIAEADYLKKHKSFFGPDTYAYIMDAERSVDIDSPIDFRIAEILMKEQRNIMK
jgi:N-acylneuraminate cytidylyltransferase/CMP-N,N'-diacetyllegionaminic acid synthase